MPVEFDLEEQQESEPLTENQVPVSYGTDENGNRVGTNGDVPSELSDDDEGEEDDDGAQSFRDSKNLTNVLSKLNASNVFLSTRRVDFLRTESGHFRDDEYKMIPSLLQENVALVCDTNLYKRDKGRLYYDETAFYNADAVPYFCITVNPFIYENMIHEVWVSTAVPCGMYFCCQGGDAAHTGATHEDYVSIRLAWFLVGLFFLAILIASIAPGDEEWTIAEKIH